jgi:hypothetical protein
MFTISFGTQLSSEKLNMNPSSTPASAALKHVFSQSLTNTSQVSIVVPVPLRSERFPRLRRLPSSDVVFVSLAVTSSRFRWGLSRRNSA